MKYIKLILIILLLNVLNDKKLFSQSNPENTKTFNLQPVPTAKQSSITFHLQKALGVGPDGFSSDEIATKNAIQTKAPEEYKAYTDTKNKPAGFTDGVEYFYILDSPQFYYQNYIGHIYSKEFLKNKLSDLKFNIADTLRLSQQPVKCYISVLGGLNKDNEPVYIIDANNNGDFSDDTVRPLLKNVYDENTINKNAVSVQITYSYNHAIKNDNIMVFMSASRDKQKFAMTFSFPQFQYSRFYFKGKPYLISTGSNPTRPYVTILPDRPYFANISADKRVKTGQFAQMEGEEIKVSDITDNGNAIILTGSNFSDFSTTPNNKNAISKPSVGKNKILVSNQTGFKAPIISGININSKTNNEDLVSTNLLKGKYVFIDFWSTYCGACIDEFKNMENAYSKYDRKQFEIIGVVDDRNENKTLQILTTNAVKWPNIKMEAKTTNVAGYKNINSYPTSYLLDKTGNIIAVDLRGEALMNKLKTLIPLN